MARILFVGINYYAYIGEIRAALERQGHQVDYHPIERVDFWGKTAKKLAPGAYRRRLDAYHRAVFDGTAGTPYDVVLFIQVHHVSQDNMQRLRALHPNAKFVLYNWDSLTTHDYRPYRGYFDRIHTFDPVDAANEAVDYLPLFAIPAYYRATPRTPPDYDLYFVGAIGTMHRFDALARLHAFCEANGVRTRFHLKCSPIVRFNLWRSGRTLPGVTMKSIDFAGIIDLIERSRGVFDFANHRQTGYTMRFIENMCAGQKIVTENPRVLDEDFYRPDRFLVIRDFDFSEIPAFLALPITSELDTERWSVDNWVRRLVEG